MIDCMIDFDGKTAVVTGAAAGIGRATALGFAKGGARVALLDIDEGGARDVAADIAASGGSAIVRRVDLADVTAGREALRSVHAELGRIDALANVAAIFPRANVPDVTEELFDRIIGLDLRGVFFLCQEAFRIMSEQRSGAIVNVASGAAFRAIEGHACYSAAKAGLVGMSRVLALECARKGFRVNVVAPGHTASEQAATNVTPEQFESIAAGLVPGRWMRPDEPANAILWLCSDAASGVNGAIINVNGGNHMPQG